MYLFKHLNYSEIPMESKRQCSYTAWALSIRVNCN